MQTETKTVMWLVATIILIVAASFAGLGYLANLSLVARAGPPFTHAADVRLVEQRATTLLSAATALWITGCVVFAQLMPRQPGRGRRCYLLSGTIVGVAIIATVAILHLTANLLKLF